MIRILKIIIYLSLFISLLFSSISMFFSDLYVSYITGYDVDVIIGYKTGDFDKSLLCKEFFPREVFHAINDLYFFSVLTFIISFISIIVFRLVSIIKKKGNLLQLKNTMRNFFILLFLAFLMSFAEFTSDRDIYYIVGCEQLQASCESIRANPENVGAKSMEELHARGEFLYCD